MIKRLSPDGPEGLLLVEFPFKGISYITVDKREAWAHVKARPGDVCRVYRMQASGEWDRVWAREAPRA